MNLSVFSFHSVKTCVNYHCPQQNLILSPPNLSNESTSGAEEQREGAPLMAVVCLTVNHRSSPLSTMTKIATCHPVSVSTCCCHLYVIGEVKTGAELFPVYYTRNAARTLLECAHCRKHSGRHWKTHVTVVPTRSLQSQSKPRK